MVNTPSSSGSPTTPNAPGVLNRVPASAFPNINAYSFGIDSSGINPKTAEPDVAHFNVAAGNMPFNTKEAKYADPALITTPNDKVIESAVKTIKQKFAPNANKPTTAAGDLSIKKLPDLIAQIDPNGIAQVMKNMMKMLKMVNMTASSNSPVASTSTITDAFTGALEIMVHDIGFITVVNAFNIILLNGGINQISSAYQSIVVNAFLKLLEDAIIYGESGIPIPVVPPIVYGTTVPSPLVILVPNLYVQQFYDSSSDPYPGYIQWLGPEGDSVYTLRTSQQPPYSSAQDQILAQTQAAIATSLEAAILSNTLSITLLNTLLTTEQVNAQNASTDAALGSGASANLMSLLPEILGQLGTAINLAESLHLPNSVLSQGGMSTTLQGFAKNMSIIKTMKNQSMSAFHLPNIGLPSLSSITSLTNALSSIGVSIPSAVNILASSGISINNITSASSLLSAISGVATVADALNSSGISVSSLNTQINTSSVSEATEILNALASAGISKSDIASIGILLKNINVS